MKKFSVVAALFLFASVSSSAFAQIEQSAPAEAPATNAVITSINVTSANGGINPSYAGVRIKGTIKAGGNACEAQQYDAGLRKEVLEGKTYFVPFLEQKVDAEPVFCILSYDMNFKGIAFDQTFILEFSIVPSVYVRGVKSEDNTVALGDLLTASYESCSNIRPFCTKQMHPTTCSYGDRTVTSNNKCEAIFALKTSVCSEERASFDETELNCEDAPFTFE